MAIAEELKVIITAEINDALKKMNQFKRSAVDLEQVGKQISMSGRKLSIAVTAPIVLAGRAVLKFAKEQEQYKDTFAKLATSLQGIGEVAAEIIVPVLDKVADILKKVSDWFSGLDEGTQKSIISMLALAAAIGPLLAVVGPLISGIGTLIKVFKGVDTALSILTGGGGTLTLILIAVAALAAAAFLIIENWDSIAAFFTKLWETVKTAFVDTWEKIKTFVVETAQAVFAWLKENWPMIVGILGGPLGIAVVQIIKHWDDIKAAFQSAYNFIKDIVTKIKDWLTNKLAAVIEPVQKVAGAVKDAFSWLSDKLVGHSIIPEMINEIDKEFGRLGPIAEKSMTQVTDAARKMQSTLEPFTDALGMMVVNAEDSWEAFKQAGKDAIVSIIKMLAEEAFVRAAAAFAALNIPGGIAWGAVGTAALVAQGVVKALGEGGIVTQPTQALIGERGPEAVIPLNRMGGMGTRVVVNVYGSVMEEEGLARRIGAIVSRQRRGY